MKKLLLFSIAFAISVSLFSQTYNMSNGTVTTCSGNFYDNGGSASTYSASQDLIYTICPLVAGSKVTLNFTLFDLEANYDYLTVYDGPNTSSPSLGSYDNNVPLLGIVQATGANASGCLTFVFHSDGTVQYAGWAASISCSTPCQGVQSVFSSSTPAAVGGYISICQGQTVSFNGSATYPQNGTSYTQSNATSTFLWDFGDGTTATGQNVTHTYANGGGYDVNLTVTDIIGCVSTNDIDIRVRVSTTPTFTGTNANPTTICLGQTSTLSGSPHMTPWSQPTGASLAGTTFLPDGSGVSYTTQLCFTDFALGQTVTGASDIVSLCMDIEHSYWGDLTISIACPNGSSMVLTDGYTSPATGWVNLGEPVDDDLSLTPGNPYTYCFTPSAGTTMDALVTATPPTYSYTDNDGTLVSSMSYIPAGNYAPEGAWSSLVGCPLNGCWTITVTDHLSSDNGFIFSWGINFNPSLYPSLWGFTPVLATQQWSGPGLVTTSTNPVTVTPPAVGTNTYTYTITDDFGCSYDTTVSVVVTSGPAVSASASPASICAGQSSTLTASGAVSYLWSTGGTNSSISVSPGSTTTYTVTGTNASGCIGTASVTVTVNAGPTVTASASPAAICAGQSATLTGSGANTYSWSSGGSGTSVSVSPSSTTTYTVTGTTVAGCTGSGSVSVTVNPLPTVTASASPASVCPGQSTSLTASGASTYSWSSGGSGTPVTVTPGGTTTYTVTGTSAAGCTGTASITVTQSPNITVTASATPAAICAGQTTSLSASGGSTYNWSTGGSGTPVSVSPASTTSYTVTGTSAAGCTGTASVSVTVNPLPTVTASASPASVCPGQSTSLTASGASTYSWSSGGSGTPINVTPGGTTTYSVTGTSAAGCTGTASVSVTVNPLPTVTATATSPSICPGSSTNLTGSGASTYAWSTGGSGTSISVSPASNTTYTVTGTSAAGCTGTASVSVSINPNLAVSAVASPAAICNGQSSTLTASGATNYSWNTSSTANPYSVSPSATTTYLVTGTDAFGCSGTASVSVTVNPLPTVTASATPAAICAGQSTSLAASGASTYAWSSGGSGTPLSITPSGSTTYTVTGTSAAGCMGTASVSVTVNPSPTVTASATPAAICAGQSTSLAASGASAYAWSSGGSGTPLSITPGGSTTYTVTGTSAAGCTGTASVSVTVNPLPTVTASATPAAICAGQSTSLAGSGASTYAWSSGGTGSPLSITPSGSTTYTVTGTSAAGCTGTASVSVTVNPIPTVSASASPTSLCLGESSTLTASGATSYSWSSGSAAASFSDIPAATTTYSVTGTSLGCSATASATVTVNPLPTIAATASPSSICLGFSSTISASGGTSYNWDNGNSTASFTESPTVNTTYTVTGTDLNGCSGTASVSVSIMPGLTVSITPPVADICEGKSTSLTASSPGTGVGYLWESGQNTATINIQPTSTTTYTVTGTDVQGCSGTADAVVNVNPLPIIQFEGEPLSGCLPLTVDFTNMSSGNISFWDWNFGDSNYSGIQNPSHTYNSAGSFAVTLIATTDDGCVDSLTLNNYINAMAPPVASFVADPPIATEDAPTILFIDESIGATQWEWEFGDGGTGSTVQNPSYTYQAAGEYYVTLFVSNSVGCTDSTRALVVIKPTYTFYLPNTFSPNSDGRNELYRPFGIGWNTDTYEMRIYNRWGELVFVTTDINHGWDGNEPKGTPAQEGVYSVKIYVKALDGKDYYYVQALHLIR